MGSSPLHPALYYVSPKPFKNGILTVFSLFFYAWGEPRYVVLMIFSVLLNYGFGRLVEKFGKKEMAFGALRDAQSFRSSAILNITISSPRC